MFIFLGIEGVSGVTSIFQNGISSVVPLGVPSWVALLVTTHGIPGAGALIIGAVDSVVPGVYSMFPGRVSIRSAINVINFLILKQSL